MSCLSAFNSPTELNGGLYQVLLEWAEADPDRVYLYGSQGTISYAQTSGISIRLAHHLFRSGKFSEQPVLAASFDHAERLLYLTWACMASGICLAFLPRIRDLAQVRLLMKQVGATALATDMPELMGMSLSIPFETLLGAGSAHGEPVDDTSVIRSLRPDVPAFIFQTSGTTGEAKWVQVRHGQFVAAIQCLRRVGSLKHAVDQVAYITPPLSHSYGMSSLLEYTLMGSAITLPHRFSPLGPVGELTNSPLASRITAIEGVPYFYSQMARLMARIKLPALRHIGFGGGALDLEAVNHIRTVHPRLSYSVRYGMTETPSVVSHKLFTPPYKDDWKSSGRVLPIYDLRIVDKAGRALSPREEGEIQIKGGCLALPYYGEEGESDGFFATGDIGYLDTDQELHVVGRKSLFLKSRGFRISPEYIESVIGTFEGVQDCRVSMRDSRLLAEVVRRGDTFSVQELLSFLAVKLPDYAIPEIVTLVQVIPRTPSGKIRRYYKSDLAILG